MLQKIFKEESNVHLTETTTCTSPSHSHGHSHEHSGEASELASLEERLRFELFLSGDEIGDEDRKVFETLKGKEVSKTQYPNVHKWLRLVAKSN
jgi:hypothetical protein